MTNGGSGGLVLGDDKLLDVQVSGCQGGLFGCHPSCFHSGTVHYSSCEMPLYIAWYCEQGGLNNTTHSHRGPRALPAVQRASCSSRIRATRDATLADTLIRTDCSSVTSWGRTWAYDPVRRARPCFLLGFLGLVTSLASLRVSLPTEPLIKRGFV